MRLIGLPEWVQSELVGRFGESVLLATDEKEVRGSLVDEYTHMAQRRLLKEARDHDAFAHPRNDVYFAQSLSTKAVKIGTSESVYNRMSALGDAVLLATEKGGFKVESWLHSQFKEARIESEWFRPTPDLMAYIAGALLPLQEASSGSGQAVHNYISSQLSLRSKQCAADSLRRLTRLVTHDHTQEPEMFPWHLIDHTLAVEIRALLREAVNEDSIALGTANLTLVHLRGLIRVLDALDLIPKDRYKLIDSAIGPLRRLSGAHQPRGRALSPLEEKRLREAARSLSDYQGVMLDAAIVLAIGGGLRREEITRIAANSLTAERLYVPRKAGRTVVIDAQMKSAVDAWVEKRAWLSPSHEALFCAPMRCDLPLSAWSFWDLVRRAAHDAFGSGGVCRRNCRCRKTVTGPHDFRRTFATRLLDQGFDIRQVQVLMAHESPETTARYDKREEQALFDKRRNARVIA